MKEFRMPSLGADMDDGTLVAWLKAPGDALKRGDIIAVVETQKGAIEIEVFDDGILEETRVQPGEQVPVGQVLAMIREPGERPQQPVVVSRPPPADSAFPLNAPPPQADLPRRAPSQSPRARITPLARRLAHEQGIDLSRVAPGADGIVGQRELAAARPERPKKEWGGRTLDPIEMRKAIAAAMVRSNRDIPHYYVSSTVDVTGLMDWLAQRNDGRLPEDRLLYAAPLLRAIALVLREFKDLNGTYTDGEFTPADDVHLGVAIAIRKGGLITPAILSADKLDVDEMMGRLSSLVRRVRSGGLRSSELSSGTATVTNLGDDTADLILPIIYPPQVAIVGCGQIRERPWVIDGAVVPRRLMAITIAGDHRVSDGRRGAQFLRSLEKHLIRPEAL